MTSPTHAAEDRCVETLALLHATRNELATLLDTLSATQQHFSALRQVIASLRAEKDAYQAVLTTLAEPICLTFCRHGQHGPECVAISAALRAFADVRRGAA